MSKMRMINTDYWTDPWVVDNLNPLDSHLFIYLFTNSHTNVAGIYELSLRTISSEIGIEKEELARMMKRLEPKVHYVNGWVVLKATIKNQNYKSPKIQTGIQIVLDKCPKELLDYIDWPKDYGQEKPQGSTQQSLLAGDLDELFGENDSKKRAKSVVKNETVDKNRVAKKATATPVKYGIQTVSHSNSNFNSNSNTAVSNQPATTTKPAASPQKAKTGTTGLKDSGSKYMEVNVLYEDLSDLVNEKYRGWYCKTFFELGRERVQRMASEARADATQDKRKLFSHMLKEAIKTTTQS